MTISSLIYQDRKQDARSFIDFLSDYLRYLFSGSDTQVTLQQETEHCKSYIQLQQIKYPDTIFYMFELASGTENIRIPKFLLQTVVENIFKHGFSPEQFLSIFLESALEADLWPRRQPAHQQRRTEWCSRHRLFARGGKPCTS